MWIGVGWQQLVLGWSGVGQQQVVVVVDLGGPGVDWGWVATISIGVEWSELATTTRL